MTDKQRVTITRIEAEKRYAKAYADARREGFEAEIRGTLPDISTGDLPWHWHDHGLTDDHVETIYVIGAVMVRVEAATKEGRDVAVDMDDAKLAEALEALNDQAHEGEGFERYAIVG